MADLTESESLGSHLKRLRGPLTLRQVEEKTGISSGHLSLIETGRVKNPSPTVLNRLAKAYDVNPMDLLVLAGYVDAKNVEARRKALSGVALAQLRDLSEDELRQLGTYVQVLRANRQPHPDR